MLEKLLHLQKTIHQWSIHGCDDDNDWKNWADMGTQLYFMQCGDLFDITFVGMCDEDFNRRSSTELFNEEVSAYPFIAFHELLSQQEIADKIIALRFQSPDEGANGTKELNFKRLVDSGVTFPNLTQFSVGLTNPTDHNTGIMVAEEPWSFNENGIIARLVSIMPKLRSLTVPSAPDKSFFEIGPLKLTNLTVQAGYDR